MLILLDTAKAAPATGGVNWDKWTAIGTLILAAGTLVLALVTFWTLLYTIRATNRDRKQAAKDREDAETRLESERKAGDQRLKDERDHAAEVRRRDRQIDRISVLAARVAEMQAYLDEVPGAALRAGWGRNSPSLQSRSMVGEEALTALNSLRHGAWTEAAMLGTGEAAEQAAGRYLSLLILVDDRPARTPFPTGTRNRCGTTHGGS